MGLCADSVQRCSAQVLRSSEKFSELLRTSQNLCEQCEHRIHPSEQVFTGYELIVLFKGGFDHVHCRWCTGGVQCSHKLCTSSEKF